MASSAFASLLRKRLRAEWDTLRTWARSTAKRLAWRSPDEGKGGRGGDIHHHPTPTAPASSDGAAATASS